MLQLYSDQLIYVVMCVCLEQIVYVANMEKIECLRGGKKKTDKCFASMVGHFDWLNQDRDFSITGTSLSLCVKLIALASLTISLILILEQINYTLGVCPETFFFNLRFMQFRKVYRNSSNLNKLSLTESKFC